MCHKNGCMGGRRFFWSGGVVRVMTVGREREPKKWIAAFGAEAAQVPSASLSN